MRLLFLFLDGVGLGDENPEINPFAKAELPVLRRLLDGKRLVAQSAPLENERATLIALDAGLGVQGLPQSATGQAVLLTGHNIPAQLGYHYGPKPNGDVAAFIKNGNLFSQLNKCGKRSAFLNAYPPGYFQGIQSGRRLYASIPLAAVSAGMSLFTAEDLRHGRALSADFTGSGWHSHLELTDTPVFSPYQSGELLAQLSQEYDFAFFEYWLSDYAGHRQNMEQAIELLGTFDQVLDGLLNTWDDHSGMILLTSDHGNLEDLSTRRHTSNPVPALIIGETITRRAFSSQMKSLTDIAPAIISLLTDSTDCANDS
jgi:2,3-bisphosphoglycerate-independent phosphoglycerate mutase